MKQLKFGNNDFWFEVEQSEHGIIVEIGERLSDGTLDVQAWMMDAEEVLELRDWLTDYLK